MPFCVCREEEEDLSVMISTPTAITSNIQHRDGNAQVWGGGSTQ